MSYLELATYLGLMAQTTSQVELGPEEDRTVIDNCRQALCETQLILYELAREELRKGIERSTQ